MLLKEKIKRNRWIMILPRILRAFAAYKFYFPLTRKILKYGFLSKEIQSFTYNLTPFNENYLIQTVATVTNKNVSEIENYFNEIKNDTILKNYILDKISKSEYHHFKDNRCDFGSRMAWYAIVRATKSSIVIENGVEIGYTAVLLCRAIQKNIEEGYLGEYFGFDIDKEAGFLIKDSFFKGFINFIYGDTVESITKFNRKVNFYFSDGARTAVYENKEFGALIDILDKNGIIASNKMLFSSELSTFSKKYNRKFIYFKEEPQHWYQGSGLGISFN